MWREGLGQRSVRKADDAYGCHDGGHTASPPILTGQKENGDPARTFRPSLRQSGQCP
jgi:hypothetical protein